MLYRCRVQECKLSECEYVLYTRLRMRVWSHDFLSLCRHLKVFNIEKCRRVHCISTCIGKTLANTYGLIMLTEIPMF